MKCCILMGAIAPQLAMVKPWSMTLLSLAVLVPVCFAMFFLREKLARRLGIFLCISTFVGGLEMWWAYAQQPQTATVLAVQQMNDSNAAAAELRAFEAAKNSLHFAAGMIVLLAALACFGSYARTGFDKMRSRLAKSATVALALLMLPLFTGCMKPYDKPEYVEIDTSETGFMIPLEGDGNQQAKFQSEEYLKQRKVAAKRVQILHRWSQEGRWETDGRWIPSVRLVKVNRSPVTREWTTEQAPTGSGVRRSDKAVWIESGDSVGFSMGFNCTAFISEDDAAKFLYWYPSGSLTVVMDQEIRGRIQQTAAEVAAKYRLDILRTKKQEIVDNVKNDVTNFFASRGVTVTTVGMFGGMTYENPEIQKSIDATFIAQQLKVVSEAKYEAQKKENERIELEANAVAEKARREASGLADAKKMAADAEAESIRKVTQALNEAQNPMLYQLKALDVERARVEKWDGHYPTWFTGAAGSSPNLLLQVPPPGGASAVK
jgi:hypothetical protein